MERQEQEAQVANRIHGASEIFRRLEQDPEGAIRDTLHVLTDLALDHAFDRIRGGPPARGESLSPAAAPALPAPAPASPVDATALRARVEQLEHTNLDIATGRANAESECRVLRVRINQLEAANRGYQDTIAQMGRAAEEAKRAVTRGNRWPASGPAKKVPARASIQSAIDAREQEKADALVAATKYEATLPPEELMDVGQIAKAVGCSKGTVHCHAKGPEFPKIAMKRGRAFLWRRVEIETWLAQRLAKAADERRAPETVRAGADFLDSRAIASSIGTSVGNFYQMISTHKFPKHSASRGHNHLWAKADVDQWMEAHRQSAILGTCETCADGPQIGRIRICRSENGPFRNKNRAPGDRCDYHRKPTPPYRPVRPDPQD